MKQKFNKTIRILTRFLSQYFSKYPEISSFTLYFKNSKFPDFMMEDKWYINGILWSDLGDKELYSLSFELDQVYGKAVKLKSRNPSLEATIAQLYSMILRLQELGDSKNPLVAIGEDIMSSKNLRMLRKKLKDCYPIEYNESNVLNISFRFINCAPFYKASLVETKTVYHL